MRSESTSALGQPRLTKPTRGTFLRAVRRAWGWRADTALALRRGRRAVAGWRLVRIPGMRPGSAGTVMHALERAEHGQHDQRQDHVRPDRRAPVARRVSGHR